MWRKTELTNQNTAYRCGEKRNQPIKTQRIYVAKNGTNQSKHRVYMWRKTELTNQNTAIVPFYTHISPAGAVYRLHTTVKTLTNKQTKEVLLFTIKCRF